MTARGTRPDPPAADRRRRAVLGQALALVVTAGVVSRSRAAAAEELALLTVEEEAARALHYTEDARAAADARPGASCQSCSAYNGATGSVSGPCTVFPGKAVKAAGWCSAWTDM